MTAICRSSHLCKTCHPPYHTTSSRGTGYMHWSNRPPPPPPYTTAEIVVGMRCNR
ncbi:hypothetical protein HanRHA438_Chr11g0493261 [Helianthus annuus]|nr:hypothetical protein HanRHA438_Chr11g0493261 [Helianthus annuus]